MSTYTLTTHQRDDPTAWAQLTTAIRQGKIWDVETEPYYESDVDGLTLVMYTSPKPLEIAAYRPLSATVETAYLDDLLLLLLEVLKPIGVSTIAVADVAHMTILSFFTAAGHFLYVHPDVYADRLYTIQRCLNYQYVGQNPLALYLADQVISLPGNVYAAPIGVNVAELQARIVGLAADGYFMLPYMEHQQRIGEFLDAFHYTSTPVGDYLLVQGLAPFDASFAQQLLPELVTSDLIPLVALPIPPKSSSLLALIAITYAYLQRVPLGELNEVRRIFVDDGLMWFPCWNAELYLALQHDDFQSVGFECYTVESEDELILLRYWLSQTLNARSFVVRTHQVYVCVPQVGTSGLTLMSPPTYDVVRFREQFREQTTAAAEASAVELFKLKFAELSADDVQNRLDGYITAPPLLGVIDLD
jgi:hypothetical protein